MRGLFSLALVFLFALSAFAETTTHEYASPGTYTPSVTVCDQYNACTTKSVTINVRGNTAPVVTLIAEPSSGLAPLTVTLTADASDPDGDSLVYSWDFGDNSPPPPSEPTVKHTYDKGTYEPSVKVSDSEGNSSEASVEIKAKRTGCHK